MTGSLRANTKRWTLVREWDTLFYGTGNGPVMLSPDNGPVIPCLALMGREVMWFECLISRNYISKMASP